MAAVVLFDGEGNWQDTLVCAQRMRDALHGVGAVHGGATACDVAADLRVQQRIQRVADVEVFCFLAQVRRPEAHGKQRALQAFHHARQGVARREFPPAGLARSPLRVAPDLACGAEFAHDGVYFEICHRWTVGAIGPGINQRRRTTPAGG